MEVKPGIYIGKVVDYAIVEPKPGKHPQVAVKFEFLVDESVRQMTYYGSLSPDAKKYTLINLIRAGLKSDDLRTLLRPGAFHNKECQLTINPHEYNGKKTSRIEWINEVGAANFKKMAEAQAASFLSELNADLRMERIELGSKAAPSPTSKVEPELPSDDNFWETK